MVEGIGGLGVVERSGDELMDSEDCLARHFQSGNESLDQEKTCQLGKVMKQNNRKELFREREAWWRNLSWSWELGALHYFRM